VSHSKQISVPILLVVQVLGLLCVVMLVMLLRRGTVKVNRKTTFRRRFMVKFKQGKLAKCDETGGLEEEEDLLLGSSTVEQCLD